LGNLRYAQVHEIRGVLPDFVNGPARRVFRHNSFLDNHAPLRYTILLNDKTAKLRLNLTVRPRHHAMRLPPLPKWNKTTDDIDTSHLFALAQGHEQSLLPSGITFPRTGQIWEAVRDCEVHFVASFTSEALAESRWLPGRPPSQSIAPATPFGQARLSRSERVRVVFADDPKPLVVWFQPLRYHELHTHIVPVEVRSAPHYSHYRLALRTAPTSRWLHHESEFFTEAFRLIEDVA